MTEATECSRRDVRTEHIGNELLLVDFGDLAIVSDHPEHMGGTGKGPMPGELLKGALAASAVLAMAAAAREAGIPLGELRAACGSDMLTERREGGPLPSLTILTGFVIAVAVGDDVSEEQLGRLEEAARNCSIAQVITGEVAITERNAFEAGAAARDAKGTTHLIEQMQANRPGAGAPRIKQAGEASQVTAEYIGAGRALLRWARASFVVGGEAGRPGYIAPEDLVLAALSACTSVFVARSAALVDARLESRVECSGEFAARGAEPVARILKTTRFTGDLDGHQREVLSHFSDNCAIGETLRRKSALDLIFERLGLADRHRESDDASAFERQADTFFSGAICDDGACCIAK